MQVELYQIVLGVFGLVIGLKCLDDYAHKKHFQKTLKKLDKPVTLYKNGSAEKVEASLRAIDDYRLLPINQLYQVELEGETFFIDDKGEYIIEGTLYKRTPDADTFWSELYKKFKDNK